MKATKSTFQEIDGSKFGIVILGASVVDGNDTGWINGVTEDLVDNEILPKGTTPEQAWEQAVYTVSIGGRTDLILYAKSDVQFHIGIMAMWRLTFNGKISWIDDWKANYASQYIPGYIDRTPQDGFDD